jgi:hypothetical protein
MNDTERLLNRIRKRAQADAKLRLDPRYLTTMGFLVAKGFLKANRPLPALPNQRLRIEDALWAGKNVEPRILEVLPAAVLRLGRHFDLDPEQHPELARVIHQLKTFAVKGDDFLGMPFAKIKVWADFPLRDKRVKASREKKIVRTYRFSPAVLDLLKKKAQAENCTETEILEKLVASR